MTTNANDQLCPPHSKKGKFSSNAWFGKLRASTPQYPKYPFNGYMVVLREER
jgi:hypothetical protein